MKKDSFLPFNEILDMTWDAFRTQSVNQNKELPVLIDDILNKILLNMKYNIQVALTNPIGSSCAWYFRKFKVKARDEYYLELESTDDIYIPFINSEILEVLRKEFINILWKDYKCVGGCLSLDREDCINCVRVYSYLTQKSVETMKKFDSEFFESKIISCNSSITELFNEWYKEKIEKKAQ